MITAYFIAPFHGVEYSADAEFLPLAISKSGAGQLDLLILEANALHGVVSLSYIICHLFFFEEVALTAREYKFADYLTQLNCKCCQIC